MDEQEPPRLYRNGLFWACFASLLMPFAVAGLLFLGTLGYALSHDEATGSQPVGFDEGPLFGIGFALVCVSPILLVLGFRLLRLTRTRIERRRIVGDPTP